MSYPLLAAAAIAGCFAFRAWRRLEKSSPRPLPGAPSLTAFVEEVRPNCSDLAGAAGRGLGASFILFAPRGA